MRTDTPRHSVSVAAAIIDEDSRILAIRRADNGQWEPPGGVLELDETIHEGLVREVLEETGLKVRLVGEKREDVEDPVQLHRPAGVQLENIGPGHQHIDLIYFARPAGPTKIQEIFNEDKVGWYGREDWNEMPLNTEVRGWCERALATLASS